MVNIFIDIDDHGTECTAYYLVEYKLTADAGYIALPFQFNTPVEIKGLQANESYDVRVTRFCCNGDQGTPTTTTISTGSLDAPTGFVATAGSEEITLVWDNMPDATNYIIQRDTVNTFPAPIEVYNGAHTASVVDNPLTPGTQYFYRIKSQASGFADSPYSTDDATTFSELDTPTSFAAVPGVSDIQLTWDNDVTADTYVIERALDAGFTMSLTTVYNSTYVSSVSDGAVVSGVTYYYRIHSEATGYTNSGYAYDNAIAP